MRLDLSPWFAPTICFVGACFALGKQAKAKAKQGQPKPKAAPLSDVGLAGKTIPEKVALARWGPTVQICNVYMCDICVFFCNITQIQIVGCLGGEAKKEINHLSSLKLDLPQGNPRFAEGATSLDQHVQTLTGFFTRQIFCPKKNLKFSLEICQVAGH